MKDDKTPTQDVKTVAMALSRVVASRKVPKDIVEKMASKLSATKMPLRGIDICAHGICLDYIVEGKGDSIWETLPQISDIPGWRVRGIEIFPWGIISPDIFHVRIEHEVEELASQLQQ